MSLMGPFYALIQRPVNGITLILLCYVLTPV